MNGNRLADYLDHMHQAATDACSFVEGVDKDDFLLDKRTQQAVIMSLIIREGPRRVRPFVYLPVAATLREFEVRKTMPNVNGYHQEKSR